MSVPPVWAEQVPLCRHQTADQFSYRKLEFHLVDSQSCQRSVACPTGRRSAKLPWRRTWGRLSRPLGRRSTTTWCSVGVWKKANGFGSSPAVQTNIHYPDSEVVRRHSGCDPVAGAAAGAGRDRLRRSYAAGQAARPEHPQPPRQEAPGRLPRSKWRPRRQLSRRWQRRRGGVQS